MNDTEKRIEVIKFLVLLRRNNDAPGNTILRALRKLAEHEVTRHA